MKDKAHAGHAKGLQYVKYVGFTFLTRLTTAQLRDCQHPRGAPSPQFWEIHYSITFWYLRAAPGTDQRRAWPRRQGRTRIIHIIGMGAFPPTLTHHWTNILPGQLNCRGECSILLLVATP